MISKMKEKELAEVDVRRRYRFRQPLALQEQHDTMRSELQKYSVNRSSHQSPTVVTSAFITKQNPHTKSITTDRGKVTRSTLDMYPA